MSYPQNPGGFNPSGNGGGSPQGGYPQQGGYQQQGFSGQQQPYGQQSFGQQQFNQAPQKSNLGLWIGVGVLGVAVLALLLWLFLGTGGQYVGKKMPSLPSNFAGWTKVEDSGLGITFGENYEKGGKHVMALSVPIDDEDKPDPTAPPSGFGDVDVPEPRKIGTGMFCSDYDSMGVKNTSCYGVWEDGVTMFMSESDSAAEEALKDFVGAAK